MCWWRFGRKNDVPLKDSDFTSVCRIAGNTEHNQMAMKTTYMLRAPVLLALLTSGIGVAQPHLVLTYSGYLGGTNSEQAFGVCVDAYGNAYITGETASIDFPKTNSPTAGFGGGTDVFVTKLNPLGAIVYSTYFGGSGNDTGRRIAVDRDGNAYITGYTASTNFPTVQAFQTNYGGGKYDCFLAKLDPSGSSLIYSTYLGGSGSEAAGGIAIDPAGNALITGWTDSKNFPIANALQPKPGGGKDVFVAKVGSNGSNLIYSTYLGGVGDDDAFFLTPALGGIVVDQVGNAYYYGKYLLHNFSYHHQRIPTQVERRSGLLCKQDKS